MDTIFQLLKHVAPSRRIESVSYHSLTMTTAGFNCFHLLDHLLNRINCGSPRSKTLLTVSRSTYSVSQSWVDELLKHTSFNTSLSHFNIIRHGCFFVYHREDRHLLDCGPALASYFKQMTAVPDLSSYHAMKGYDKQTPTA